MIYLVSRRMIVILLITILALTTMSWMTVPSSEDILAQRSYNSYELISDPGRLFNIDEEINIPTWFTAFLALYAGFICSLLGQVEQSKGELRAGYWRFLAVLLLYISLDEVAGIHELAIEPIRQYGEISPWLYQSWIILFGALAGILGIVFIPFFIMLPWRVSMYLILAGVVYITGAIGMESIGGFILATQGLSDQYILLAHIEEFLEMMGLLLVIYTSSEMLRHGYRSCTLVFR